VDENARRCHFPSDLTANDEFQPLVLIRLNPKAVFHGPIVAIFRGKYAILVGFLRPYEKAVLL